MMDEEHWEIASLADAFEDWPSASYHRGRKRSPKRLRLQATGIGLARCERCGAVAEWHYIPAGGPGARCDRCVSRNCTCRVIVEDSDIASQTRIEPEPDRQELVWTVYDAQTPRQGLDSFGRELPCIEWEFYPGGVPRSREDTRARTRAPRRAQGSLIEDDEPG